MILPDCVFQAVRCTNGALGVCAVLPVDRQQKLDTGHSKITLMQMHATRSCPRQSLVQTTYHAVQVNIITTVTEYFKIIDSFKTINKQYRTISND